MPGASQYESIVRVRCQQFFTKISSSAKICFVMKLLSTFVQKPFSKFFFSIWVLFHEHSRITGLQGKGEGIPLIPHWHFHPLHRHLDIGRVITKTSLEHELLTDVFHGFWQQASTGHLIFRTILLMAVSGFYVFGVGHASTGTRFAFCMISM